MEKNYPGFSSCFKPGLFLVVFLFFCFSGFGQSITNVTISETEVCTGNEIEISFQANNVWYSSFDNNTNYIIAIGLYNSNNQSFETFHQETFQSSQAAIWGVRVFERNFDIPLSLEARDDYQILVSSTNPNVRTTNGLSEVLIVDTTNTFSETEEGSDSWVGHIYEGTNQNRSINESFTNYIGGYTENLSFDQNFGGNTNNFLLGSGNCASSIFTETFSVRFRMRSSLKGLYSLNIGSDDGSRLNIDGELIYNDWNDHGYRDQNILVKLSGNSNLVLDYYENGGGNRISVGPPQLLIENILTGNLEQTLESQNSSQSITGDEFANLPNGLSRFGNGYQWVYSTVEGGETTNIPGASQASYTPNLQFFDEGTYYIYRIATITSSNNRLGSAYTTSIKSNPATIVVEEPIQIIDQPENNTVCQGSQANFKVNADGQNLSYRWQRNDGGNSQNFFDINGNSNFQNVQTSTLSVNASGTWLNNLRFRVIITDQYGNSITSNSALLQVNQGPQGINTQPSNQVVCEGNDISFQTYTSNDQRQWQVSEDNGVSWSDLINNEFYQNVNSERLDINNTPSNFQNNLYRIEVSNQNCSVYSNSASLQVDLDPITEQPQDATAAFGDNAVIEAGVTGNNLSYQWQTFSSNWYNINDDGNYSGTETTRLELITIGYFPVDGSRYRLLVTNENGCVSISETAFLNVGENQCPEEPTVSLRAPLTTCPGQINISGSFTGTAPWNIEATINGQNFNLSIPERDFSYPIDIQENTTIEILKITDGNGCENITPNESVSINVIDGLENNTISGAQQSCGELEASILTGEDLGEGYTYVWEISTTGEISGFNPAPGNNTEVNYNPGTVSETTWYRRKVAIQNCSEDISNTIQINLGSEIVNNNISFFNGNSASLQATANENQNINLSAPQGTVFTYINFSSYGTPTNDINTFSIDENCHATTSRSITESYLLGENSAIIPATNGVFTDPCVGTVKRLYVTATYAEAFCSGSNPGTVTGTAINGNNIEYLWQISTTGEVGSFAAAPGNNNQQNYNPGVLNQNTWLKRIVNSGSCSDESPVLYIPIIEENVWNGDQDTNWNNTNNWSCNTLPTIETNVLIPESLVSGNYPEISAGANAYTRNLTIENNASVIVSNNWLRIAGTLITNGILNTEKGSISFQGEELQNIPASSFENNRIRNLRIDNNSGVASEAVIEVTGILKVENGNFETGDELTLISDANQTALIDGRGNGEVTGLVSMQRYLDKAFGYKYFSSPFQNSRVGDFAAYIDFIDPETEFPNFYRYDENRNVDINDTIRDATGWETYTNFENNLNVAEGYALNFGTSADAQTIDLIGVVNNGTIPARQLENNHREYTKGFHLVGNPYPSPIDWNAPQGWTRNNIDDGIYFFTAGDDSQYTGTYTAYVNNISTAESLVDGRSSNIIPSMQGFFIKVSDSDTQDLVTGRFGMDNNVRVSDFDQEFLRSQEDLKPLIRLEAGFQGTSRKDPMVIYFSTYATPNFEKEMDAHKLMNTEPNVPSFYNITGDKKELSINAIPFPEHRSFSKIPLGIKADKSGEMKINLASMENLSPNFNIYLIDHEKSIGQNLSRKPEYRFRIKNGIHNSRFELMFSEEEVTSPAIAFNEPFDVEVREGNVVVNLNLERNQQGILRASTMTGQILQVKPGGGKDKVIFDGITSDGVYIINLQLGKAQYAKKVVIKK